jgi:error-prone DNA polymerase
MPEDPNEKLYRGAAIERPTKLAPGGGYDYAELDVTTNFSFLRGASHPDEMVYAAALLGHRATAVTDVNTLAGVVRAHAAAREVEGFKLIVGARLVFADGTPDLLVWAPDREAYGRLCRILTTGRRRARKGECHLALDDFLEHHAGLLAALAPAEPDPGLAPTLRRLRDVLGDRLSLAASCYYAEDNETRLARFAALGRAGGVPLVATNHVHYHDPGRRPLQDVLTCVRHGCTIHDAGYRLFPNAERHMKSGEQMHALFRDHPRAIERGLDIAGRCTFSLGELKYQYPDEVVPQGKSMDEHLRELAYAGAADRYPNGVSDHVRGLLEKELTFIREQRYAAYFLTVHDLVRFARSGGILCQGRGSAANSAVCYCLGVTSVDPEHFQLVFERFIGPQRAEPPDIDIDFEHERREEVIQYVYDKYGRDRAAMTAVVISYRGRSAVRDVGKALGIGPDVLDQLAGKLDWWHRGTLDDSQLREAGADPADPTIRRLISLTAELLGFPRHLSQHVGGLVISRGPLCESVPIENCAMEGRTVVEWDKDDIDVVGMFKVDCLGLGMLTALSKGLLLANGERESRGEPPLELHTIPHEATPVYDMICDADTVGVFQIESRAQMSMLPRLKPREFYDLVIEVAIVRPGPIQGDMVHPYLQRRNSNEPIDYPNDALREVLAKTLGVPLFQEQAMRVVMIAASFSAAEADRLRRAMAAWKRNGHIDMLKARIILGMRANGYPPDFAEQLFRQIQGFGSYGFPESHAASFAKLVYASAWLKRYHPAAFCAALLNSQPMGFYQPAQLVRDAKEHGVEVRTVDVNHSEWDCTLEGGRHESDIPGKAGWGLNGPALRLGFRQVKGMTEAQAKRIVDARAVQGWFTSVAELHQVTRLPAAVLRRLAEADAFGSMGLTRRQTVWHVLELKDERLPIFEERNATHEDAAPCLPFLPPMPLGQEVMTDYATQGLSLKAHPVSFVRQQLDRRNVITTAELADPGRSPHGRWVKVAGLVLVRQRPGTASGVVFETIEDETGVANLILWSDVYDRYRPAARHAGLLQADGYVQREGQVVHVLAKRLFDLSHLLAGFRMESRDFH